MLLNGFDLLDPELHLKVCYRKRLAGIKSSDCKLNPWLGLKRSGIINQLGGVAWPSVLAAFLALHPLPMFPLYPGCCLVQHSSLARGLSSN
jgi:hypothetical protein